MSLEHSPARQRLSRSLFEPDKLYSAEEIRDKLGGRTHIVTIFRWAKTGVLPKPIRIGGNTTRWLGRDLNENLLKD